MEQGWLGGLVMRAGLARAVPPASGCGGREYRREHRRRAVYEEGSIGGREYGSTGGSMREYPHPPQSQLGLHIEHNTEHNICIQSTTKYGNSAYIPYVLVLNMKFRII